MNIVLVEDFVLYRQFLRKVCIKEFGYKVVGETDSGLEAVNLILRLEPDLVLLDLVLPGLDGFAVVQRVYRENPAVRFLAISAYADDYTLYRIEKSGLRGYVDKGVDTVEALHQALRAVENGETYFSKKYHDARALRQSSTHFSKLLSDWECTILGLIGHGLGDVEIGAHLQLSAQTVQSHRSHIMRKLELKGTPKLIAFAIEHGFTHILPAPLQASIAAKAVSHVTQEDSDA